MLKFLFQGAQGVGKTTLIDSLENNTVCNLHISSVRGVARNLITSGITKDISTKELDYFAYYYKYLSTFTHSNGEIILFDRSILDTMVYSIISYGHGNWIELLGKEIFQLIKNQINEVFYIPIEFELEDNNIRNTSIDNQKSIDIALVDLMISMDINYHIISGDIEKRKSEVIKIISESVCRGR